MVFFSVGLQLLRSEIVKEFFQNLFRMILHDEIEIHPQIVHLWWDILYLLIKITSVPEPWKTKKSSTVTRPTSLEVTFSPTLILVMKAHYLHI